MVAKLYFPGCEVLAFNEIPYTNKTTGKPGLMRSIIVRNAESIFKLSVGRDFLTPDGKAIVGKTVEFEMEASVFGDSITPDFRVVAVKKK